MAKKKKVKFDETNLRENEEYLRKANFKKIVEEKTPYYSDANADSISSCSESRMKEFEDIDSEIKDDGRKQSEKDL